MNLHRMTCADSTAADAVFLCDECGRRVVVGKRIPRLVVLDRGEVHARHVGGTGGMELVVNASTF
jgi:hypothetical protein